MRTTDAHYLLAWAASSKHDPRRPRENPMISIDVRKSGLTAEQAEIVRQTLPAVGVNIGEITPNFYRRMFTAHPELLADTFNRGNQKQGAQQKALAASVATFAEIG